MSKINWYRPHKSNGLQIKGKKPETGKTISGSNNRSRKSPLEKHRDHIIYVIEGPFHTNKPGLVHAGKIMCKKCNSLIKWATQTEIDLYKQKFINTDTTYQDFVNQLHKSKQTKDPRYEYIYLIVTYQEKEQVKALGARWDNENKLWYIPSSSINLQNLKPWIHESDQSRLGLI